MARFAATMVLLSAVFWIVSRPPISTGPEFPNCIAAGLDGIGFEIGFISNQGVNTLFATRRDEIREPFWYEGRDGHNCSWFPRPTPADQSDWGFSLQMNSTTAGWDCPYWLMTATWSLVLWKYLKRWQFRVGDLLFLMTILAIMPAIMRAHYALPVAVLLNLLTGLAYLLIAIAVFISFFRTPNPLWPLTLEAENES